MGSPPSAAHTTPWPRPRPSRGLWPEARSSDGAAPPSRPCRTGTAAPELKRSDDPPHAPWFASATPGPSVYPQPQPSGIPADPFSRSPYHFNAREVRRVIGGTLREPEAMDAACAVLVEAGLIRPRFGRAGETKGRAARNSDVNPAVFGGEP